MGPALHCFLSIFQVELIIKMSTGHCDLFDVKFWSWCPDSKFLKIFHALVCVKFCLDCNSLENKLLETISMGQLGMGGKKG